MKRAIYVGETTNWVSYGMTGSTWEDSLGRAFLPDGVSGAMIIPRADLYIPSEDQTRHCPKPS